LLLSFISDMSFGNKMFIVVVIQLLYTQLIQTGFGITLITFISKLQIVNLIDFSAIINLPSV